MKNAQVTAKYIKKPEQSRNQEINKMRMVIYFDLFLPFPMAFATPGLFKGPLPAFFNFSFSAFAFLSSTSLA